MNNELLTNELPDSFELANTAPVLVGKDFILAGNSTFTVVGKNERFTYHVNMSEYHERKYFFVSVLTGQNNETDYSTIGMLNPTTGAVTPTRNATVALNAKSAVALMWTLKKLFTTGNIAPAVIHHEGRCGRCNRKLTVPESIQSGFGPECVGKISRAA